MVLVWNLDILEVRIVIREQQHQDWGPSTDSILVGIGCLLEVLM